ncbi:SWIM zinc finger family protein [Foetidibacter luteolus]|uniref:SWIM zinc finger family protein n=1 Tax=Foetidibacter luteolus TaxID=2608880 RepID=UPI00129B4794|nr:SWIM zinc finger family protein [Foetidibacter luteolus]
MQLLEEQVLNLAPDESSKKAGKELSSPSKWVSKGISDKALWGECQGSGSKPYQTQVDIVNLAFKCSCPSRKFPCKHGLGLLLQYSRNTQSFALTEEPAWVQEWISKRADKEEKKAEKADKSVDTAAQAKRLKAREENVLAGIEELLLWIKDIVRNGILDIPGKDAGFFNSVSKRMIDAQAPGLAGMVKSLGAVNFFAEGWQSIFLDQLVRIYLVAIGFRNRDMQSPLLQEDLKTFIGFTQSQEELKEQPGIDDYWLVIGKQVAEEESLTTERNWLYGAKSKQYALVLQFSVRGQGITFSLTTGMWIQAELVFYASVHPLRAIIKKQVSTKTPGTLEALTGWQQVAANETAVFSQLPFAGERVFIMEKIKPVYYNQQWWLADADNRLVRLKEGYAGIYTLLSLSGGDALNMAVLGKENVYEPLGIWQGNDYISVN